MRLLIVYNAEAGIVAGMKDSIHKLLSPDTYPCGLCALTHGAMRMDPAWRRFIERVPVEVAIHHRPDFRAAYPGLEVALPAILIDHGAGPDVLISCDEFERINTVDALIARVERGLG